MLLLSEEDFELTKVKIFLDLKKRKSECSNAIFITFLLLCDAVQLITYTNILTIQLAKVGFLKEHSVL